MMHKVKLLCLAALALFAFGAFAATSAGAEETKKPPEEENNPRILVAAGEAKVLTMSLKGTAPIQLIGLAGTNTISATAATLSIEKCTQLVQEKDTNLCKDQAFDLTGVKQGAVACRSENNKGEKDPIETVLALLDLHVVAQLSTEKVLKPAIQAQVLGTALEEELKLNCGVVKIQDKGTEKGAAVFECLVLPGLEQAKTFEMLCKVNETTHDPIVGTCNVLCTDFGAVGMQADLNGMQFEHVWLLMHLSGEANKEMYLDD